MKTLKVEDNIYKELHELAFMQKKDMDKLLEEAIHEGVSSMKERHILELYRNNEITLAKGAELLSIDIWQMIEKLRKADIHLDYGEEELREDLCQ